MQHSNLIQSLCALMEDEDCSIESKPYKKEWDESNKCFAKLEEYIKKDEKLHKIFFEYDMADGLYQGATNDYYFKQGFLYGARLMIEILGK